MNALARTSVSSLPTLMPPQLDKALRAFVSRLQPAISAGETRYAMSAADAPSDEVRGSLVARRDRIDGWMAPAGPEMASEEYQMLCATLSAAALDDDMARREMMGFIEATHRLPAFALSGACAAFRSGKIGDGQWMPKAGQICIEAQKRIAGLAKERRELDAVLTAEIRTIAANAELKKRLLAEAADACATMSQAGWEADSINKGRDGSLREPPFKMRYGETADAYRARMLAQAIEAAKQPLPPLSAALRASLNLPPEPAPSRFHDEDAA